MNFLLVIDMQNDFISGALGSSEACAIVNYVANKISNYDGEIIFTRDTHETNYLDTREGSYLPVTHCVRNTAGWEICEQLHALSKNSTIIDKPTFGSTRLIQHLEKKVYEASCSEGDITFTLIGLCTDICVISNAFLLKASFPESKIIIDSKGCAGVTPKSHENALSAMQMCHMEIL